MLKLKTMYGSEINVKFRTSRYTENDNLYVGLMVVDDEGFEEPWSNLTVNLSVKLNDNQAYIDTNNNGEEIIDWLIKLGLGKVVGHRTSGFCTYPLFQFNMLNLLYIIATQDDEVA